MKPTIGRIVHVRVYPGHNNGGEVAPAVITRVNSDGSINLRLLYDAPPAPPEESRREWMTSVTLFEDREALEAHRAAIHASGPGKHTVSAAFWPPRA